MKLRKSCSKKEDDLQKSRGDYDSEVINIINRRDIAFQLKNESVLVKQGLR